MASGQPAEGQSAVSRTTTNLSDQATALELGPIQMTMD
jgi:hypothetical protein